jgi:hypothetical protein
MRVILAPMQGVLDHLMREVLTSVNGLGADFQGSRSMGGAARSAPSVAAGGPTGETFAIAWEDDDGAERGVSLRRIPR